MDNTCTPKVLDILDHERSWIQRHVKTPPFLTASHFDGNRAGFEPTIPPDVEFPYLNHLWHHSCHHIYNPPSHRWVPFSKRALMRALLEGYHFERRLSKARWRTPSLNSFIIDTLINQILLWYIDLNLITREGGPSSSLHLALPLTRSEVSQQSTAECKERGQRRWGRTWTLTVCTMDMCSGR